MKMPEAMNAPGRFRDLPGPAGLPFLGNLHLVLEEWALR